MGFTSPLVMMLMEQEAEEEERRREEARRGAQALAALRESWKTRGEDQGPYARYR